MTHPKPRDPSALPLKVPANRQHRILVARHNNRLRTIHRRNVHTPRIRLEHRRKLRFGASALEAITRYAWPGNVRELENAVERAVLMSRTKFIEAADLGIDVTDHPELPSLREVRHTAERRALVEALVRTRGNVSQASRLLMVSRPTLHGLIAKHRVSALDFR